MPSRGRLLKLANGLFLSCLSQRGLRLAVHHSVSLRGLRKGPWEMHLPGPASMCVCVCGVQMGRVDREYPSFQNSLTPY